MPTPLSFGPLWWNGCASWRAASCGNAAGDGKPVTFTESAAAPSAPGSGALPISTAYSAASAASALVAFDAVVAAVAAGAFGSVAACQMTSSSASNASEHSAALLLNVNRRIAVIQFLLRSGAFDGEAIEVSVGSARVESASHHRNRPVAAVACDIRWCLAYLLHRVLRVGQQEYLLRECTVVEATLQ